MIFANLYALGTRVSIISDIFRDLSFILDGIIYSLIPAVYGVIYSLYDFTALFKDANTLMTIVKNMSSTIYSFLAIFMFFRTAFSLITMLVDPNVIDDKEKGAKKIVTNIMICLLLIVIVPYGFRYAKMIQSRVMENHLIEKVVTGSSYENDSYDFGNELALSVWGVFLRPFDANSITKSAYDSVFNSPNKTGWGSLWPLTALGATLNSVVGIPVIADIVGRVPVANNVLNLFDAGTYYQLSYVYFLSTAAGLYVLWAFIKIMVDVAYRSIKFFVLELLSPIAIISYIDPSSSKKGIFSKWLNETIKTYISLFIRVFVFALASVLLRAFSLSDVGSEKMVVNLVYLLAIIAFIKTAPKFIDNLFGTSISKESESTLGNAMKSVLGFAGAATGAVAGGISNAVVAKRTGKNGFKAAVAGAWNGGKKGLDAGKKGGFGGMTGVVANAYGSYGDAKKKFGYEEDKDFNKLVDNLEGKVDDVDTAKSNAINDLMANGRKKYNEKLSNGVKVNGRSYGKGLEKDEGLENALKKNAAGLAKDELLHADDAEYLELRRLVAQSKETEAIVSRTKALADAQYASSNDSFNSSSNKRAFAVSFETETARMQYNGMDAAALKDSFTTELSNYASHAISSGVSNFNNASDSRKVDMLVSITGMDRDVVSKMSSSDLSSEYQRALTENINSNISEMMTSYSSAPAEQRVNIVAGVKHTNLEYEVSEYDERALADRFEHANDERILTTFGQSRTNMADDAGKASGDAKAAQDGLDKYLKSGKGKKAIDIDAAYNTADNRHKARKLEEKRRQQNNS